MWFIKRYLYHNAYTMLNETIPCNLIALNNDVLTLNLLIVLIHSFGIKLQPNHEELKISEPECSVT